MSRLKYSVNGSKAYYECEDLDAGLIMHAHPPGSGMEHDIHCTKGSLLVYVHPNKHFIVNSGETLEIDTTLWHGIIPLEIGTKFMNTNSVDGGTFETVIESPHQAPDWVLKIRDSIQSDTK